MAKQITNAVLADKLDNLTELVKSHIVSDEKHFESLNMFINGNGAPGAKTRIDRLEQVEQGRTWNFRMLWTALVGTALTVALNWVWK